MSGSFTRAAGAGLSRDIAVQPHEPKAVPRGHDPLHPTAHPLLSCSFPFFIFYSSSPVPYRRKAKNSGESTAPQVPLLRAPCTVITFVAVLAGPT